MVLYSIESLIYDMWLTIKMFVCAFCGMWGIMVLFVKYNGFGHLNKFAATRTKERWYLFFLRLSKCEFCIEHHFCLVSLIVCDLLMYHVSISHIFIPFVCASLSNIIKTIKNGNP